MNRSGGPSARAFHAMTIDDSDYIYIMGGKDANGLLNDLYRIKISQGNVGNWEKLTMKGL